MPQLALHERPGLPETTTFKDEGCDLHPACLACPLPVCRYEMPAGRARAFGLAVVLRQLLLEGFTMESAAAKMGVSRRTAYRLKSNYEVQMRDYLVRDGVVTINVEDIVAVATR